MKKYLPYIAWWQSLAAIFGSLYFSEVKGFAPCTLCWYQRIFIYPLAFIIPIGIYKKDKNMAYYVLALAIPGALIAVYHNLLYYGIITEKLAPCAAGVSCTTKYVQYFGFVTIPLLSLMAFLLVIACMILFMRQKGKKRK